MKEYCVDLEIAKELKENGFPQKSYFYHVPGKCEYGWDGYELYDNNTWSITTFHPKDACCWNKEGMEDNFKYDEDDYITEERENELNNQVCSAPTSDEILKELPTKIKHKEKEYWIYIIRDIDDNYQIYYETSELPDTIEEMKVRIIEKKLCNALAKMWLYLKKEGYL